MASLQNKKRIAYFDILKCFAIFLVIWGHCIQHLLSGDYADNPVYRIIYAFHMPLFMLLSGFFAFSSLKKPFAALFKGKTIQLLLPCLSWGLLLGVAWAILLPKGIAEDIKDTVSEILTNYWFLKSLFLCYLLSYIALRIKPHAVGIALALLVSQAIPTFQMGIMYPFFLIGIGLNLYFEYIKKYGAYILAISATAFVVLLLFWDDSFFRNAISIKSVLQSQDAALFLKLCFQRGYRIVIGFFGSITCVAAFYILFKDGANCKFTNTCARWGQCTLGVYLLQYIFLANLLKNYLKLDALNLNFFCLNFAAIPLISACMLALCIGLIRIIQKSAFLNCVLLGERKKQPVLADSCAR